MGNDKISVGISKLHIDEERDAGEKKGREKGASRRPRWGVFVTTRYAEEAGKEGKLDASQVVVKRSPVESGGIETFVDAIDRPTDRFVSAESKTLLLSSGETPVISGTSREAIVASSQSVFIQGV